MKKTLLVVVALFAFLSSLVHAGEIHRPTNWANGYAYNAGAAADGNDNTWASVAGGSINYTGFGAASGAVTRLQLHIRWDCLADQGDGDEAGCNANLSTDGGSTWVSWNNYTGPLISTWEDESLGETIVDLDPTTDLTKVVVFFSGDQNNVPGYDCSQNNYDGCINIPPRYSYGVMGVHDVWLDATLGAPQTITLRATSQGNNPPNILQFCYGTRTYSTTSNLSAAYDNDPNSSGYVYGTGGGNTNYSCSASYLSGFPLIPSNAVVAKLTLKWSCTASTQYWSGCDYGVTYNGGSSWQNVIENGNGTLGTYTTYLTPATDLSNFWVGVGAKAQRSGWSYAYLYDARIDVYTVPATTMTELAASPNPANYGSNVTLSAMVDTAGATPTGTVTFKDGSTVLGSSSVQTKTVTNLAKWSEAIGYFVGVDGWVSGGAGITTWTNWTANPYDGATTAFQSNFLAAPGSSSYLTQSISPGGALGGRTFTFSTWLKAPAPQSVLLLIQETGEANASNQLLVPVTTTWQRYFVTITFPAGETTTSFNIRYQVNNNSASVAVNPWGAQVEESNAPGPYIRTSSSTATGQGGVATFSTSALTAGSHSLTAQYSGNSVASTSAVLAQTVNAPPISITTATLPFGTTGAAYTATLAATGGTTPYSWSINAGSLPVGLSLNTNTGAITGTPTVTATSSFTVRVSDANGGTATQGLNIVIYAPLNVATTTLPGGTYGSSYSATLAASGGSTPYSWSIVAGSLPAGLNLNGSTGVISGTPTATGTSSFTIKVTDLNGSTGQKTLDITVNPTPMVTTSTLPTATGNAPYSSMLAATGGVTPYAWSIVAGSLPVGLSLNASTGAISGTPTAVGTFSFTVRVSDTNNGTAQSNVTLTISPLPAVTTASLAVATLSAPYNAALSAAGGTTPYSWSLVAGGLPSGLSLNASTGVISGTPTAVGTSSFTVRVTDANGGSGTKDLSLTVNPPPTITTGSLATATQSAPYSNSLAATDGATPYSWSVASGSLPPGLSLNGSGVISGTPTALGPSSFTLRVTDANGGTGTKDLTLTVNPPPTITTGSLATATQNGPYSKTLAATDGVTPYTWSVASGSLPPGLSLSGSLLSGIPTTAGTSSFTLKVTDANGGTGTKDLAVTVNAQPAITTASLAIATQTLTYNNTLAATGGVTPYSWSVASGSLPVGVTLNSSSGEISGTPTAAGAANFTIQVTDANGGTATRDFVLTVLQAPTITTPSLPNGSPSKPYSATLTATGGTTPYSWLVSTGNLPAGLSLDSNSGTISGTPTAIGASSFTVQVKDTNGVATEQAFSMTVAQPIPVAEIHRPTTWNALPNSLVTSAAAAADGDDATAATVAYTDNEWTGAGSIDYGGFTAASDAVSSLQLHIKWSCEAHGNFAQPVICAAQLSTDGGNNWVLFANNFNPLPNAYASQDWAETVFNLDPTTDLRQVVVRVNGQSYYDPGYQCPLDESGNYQDPSCESIPSSQSWGVMKVRDLWLVATVGEPAQKTVLRATANGVGLSAWWAGCYLPGQHTNPTVANLSNAYDADPNSSGSVTGGSPGNGWITCSPAYVTGYPAMPADATVAKLTIGWSCNSNSGDYCDYGSFFQGAGASNWQFLLQKADGQSGVSSVYLAPGTDLSNFGVTVAPMVEGASHQATAYLSETRIDVYKPFVASPLSVTTSSLPDGHTNVVYSATLGAVGGQILYSTQYKWSIAGGSLPAGLTLDENSGVISGVPTIIGVSNFTVQATDPGGSSAQRNLSIAIGCKIYRPKTWIASGVTSTPSYAADGDNATIGYAGTWEEGGSVTYSNFGAADANGLTRLRMHIRWRCDNYGDGLAPGCDKSISTNGGNWLPFDSPSLTETTDSQGMTESVIDLDPGTDMTKLVVRVWGISSHTDEVPCPPGSGEQPPPPCTPIDATYSWGSMAVSDVWLEARSAMEVTTTSLPSAVKGTPYPPTKLSAKGASGLYQWQVVSGDLPPGLTLDENTGVISGTPAEAGTLSFTVEVTDGADAMADQDLSLTVNLPPDDTGGGTGGGTGGANPIAKFTVQRDYDNRGRVISETDTSVAEDQTVTPVYSYSLVPDLGGTQGYEANGNVLGYNDSVMGKWSFSYDQLNRLTGASASAGHYQGLNVAWGIDPFGNRTGEVYSGNPTVALATPVNWVNYDGNNRMTNSSQVMGGYAYDAAGDTTFDGANTYTYDAEGRVSTACAGLMCTKYVYDAEGRRVAKGSYDAQSGAFTATEQYILGLGGEEVTALSGDGHWLRTNAYLGGALLATYKDDALYFQFTDWLGSKRVQISNTGAPPELCRSLPYGNQLECFGGPEVDPHHFTGKQRDSETGLDYFGARYYNSNLGRWTIPDWSAKVEPVPYAKLDNPQSLNLYAYVGNNPLAKADPDGHCPAGLDSFCNKVKVEAKVDQQAAVVQNKTVNDVNGKTIAKSTGVEGKIVDTVKVNGQPAPGVKVTEANKTSTTENGQPLSAIPAQGKGTTNENGQIGDTIGTYQSTSGSKANNNQIRQDYKNNVWTVVDIQTMTLTFPGGQTCSATSTRTLTNAGPDGSPNSKYDLSTTQPVVTPSN